jgi:hypothetical protein
MCSPLRLPGDFDIVQINWRPDYDPFFYQQVYPPGETAECWVVANPQTEVRTRYRKPILPARQSS